MTTDTLERTEGRHDEATRARNARVVANQGLVHLESMKFMAMVRAMGSGLEREDLVQFGNIGLVRAAEKYEPDRGFRFSTYAIYWIRQSIFKGIEMTGHPIRVPRRTRRDAKEFAKALGGESWSGDAAVRLEPRRIRRWMMRNALAADHLEPIPSDWDFFDDGNASVARLSALEDAERRVQVDRAMELLAFDLKLFLVLRYGLDGEPPLTMKAIGARLGCSWQAVYRIERLAVAALRALLNPRPILPNPPLFHKRGLTDRLSVSRS